MKKQLHTLLSILTLMTTSIFGQTQKGDDILGDTYDTEYGYSVSMPDPYTIAGGASRRGYVKIMRWTSSGWVTKGSRIENIFALGFGKSISMSDSNTIAIGAPNAGSARNRRGLVQVFKWSGTAWIQKGLDIVGEAAEDESGTSVSMPDSNTVAIGSPKNDGNGNFSGNVRVYKWNGTAWIQKGIDIDGHNASESAGHSVSMPDSNTVAIGAFIANVGFSGKTRIYKWNGLAWVQKGMDIDGESPGDVSGCSVSMPDSNTVAIGAELNSGNGTNSGSTRVYKWNGTSWVQKGIDLDGENANDYSGVSVSMPDSNTVAIGAHGNDGSGIDAGHARVFEWIGNAWVQKGIDIDGTRTNDLSGRSVSMPDINTIATGAFQYGFRDTGQVRVFDFCKYIPDTLTPSVCKSYTSPSGKYNWTNSGTYRDTIFIPLTCDIYYIINLSVNDNSDTLTTAVCDSLISPSGKYIWRTSGTYTDTIQNSFACDSVITFNLTVNKNDVSVANFTTSIASNSFGGTYQWVYCDSNYAFVPGATSQIFTPTTNGNYAVIVTENGCTDTSACETVLPVGISENVLGNLVFFPNPTNGITTISFGNTSLNTTIRINSLDGRLIHEQQNINSNQVQVDLTNQLQGIYFVTIQHNDAVRVIKLVRN